MRPVGGEGKEDDRVVWGLLLLVGAVVSYNLGTVLQAAEARRTDPALGLSPRLLLRLARTSWWARGVGLTLVGWGMQAGALLFLPVVVVLPGLALGLVFLLAASRRVLHEPAGAREVLSVVAIVGGIALVAGAAPKPGPPSGQAMAWLVGSGPLVLGAALPYLQKLKGRPPGWLVAALSAGCAYAISGLSTALVSRWLQAGALLPAAAACGATALAGGVGLLSETSALQSGRVVSVTPVLVLVDSFVPAILAPFLFVEPWPGGLAGAGMLSAGLALAAAGALGLATSGSVAVVQVRGE